MWKWPIYEVLAKCGSGQSTGKYITKNLVSHYKDFRLTVHVIIKKQKEKNFTEVHTSLTNFIGSFVRTDLKTNKNFNGGETY